MAISLFPSGSYNLQAKTPKIASANTSSTTSVDVINISGSGLLTGITQAIAGGTSGGATITVILDGVTLISDIQLTRFTDSNNQLSLAHKFNSSLQIQHKATSATISVTTVINYLLN